MGFIILINSPLSKNTGLCFFPETLEWQSDPGVCINLHPYCVHNLMFEVENKDIVYTVKVVIFAHSYFRDLPILNCFTCF